MSRMISQTQETYDEHMDDLALRIAEVCEGEPKYDVALTCAFVICYSICEHVSDSFGRNKLLDFIFEFMRSIIEKANAGHEQ